MMASIQTGSYWVNDSPLKTETCMSRQRSEHQSAAYSMNVASNKGVASESGCARPGRGDMAHGINPPPTVAKARSWLSLPLLYKVSEFCSWPKVPRASLHAEEYVRPIQQLPLELHPRWHEPAGPGERAVDQRLVITVIVLHHLE